MVVTGESRTKELGGSLLRKRSTSRKAFAVGVRARSELAGALSKGRVGSAVSRGQATTRAREYSGLCARASGRPYSAARRRRRSCRG